MNVLFFLCPCMHFSLNFGLIIGTVFKNKLMRVWGDGDWLQGGADPDGGNWIIWVTSELINSNHGVVFSVGNNYHGD